MDLVGFHYNNGYNLGFVKLVSKKGILSTKCTAKYQTRTVA